MIYGIESKNDLLTGSSLIVTIPGDELDRKALRTILADKPEFILPFRHRSIDGQIEFVYQIGMHCKLQYLSGERPPKEYAEQWSAMLRPLLDCGDWFMNPYSFVLSAEYLYCDKNKKTVGYVYIPSIRACSDYDALREMAADISKLISVPDAELENRVLRAIMKDFSPNEFLQMLKSHVPASTPPAHAQSIAGPWHPPARADSPARAPKPADHMEASFERPPYFEGSEHGHNAGKLHDSAQEVSGDIIINIPLSGAPAKKNPEAPEAKKRSKGKKEKEDKKPKGKRRLFGKKKNAEPKVPEDVPAPLAAAGYGISEASPDPAEPIYTTPADTNDITQSIPYVAPGTKFRLVGSAHLPPIIDVLIKESEVFTVGRFDAAVGKQQSSFEFDKRTKAVSRRHAAIERSADSYSIIDLSSSSGTFINGQQLPPNTPFELGHGCRVSFGNAGADYVWEG
jgi:hypothetical protein